MRAPNAIAPRQSNIALTGPSTLPATRSSTPVGRWIVARPAMSVRRGPLHRALAGDDRTGVALRDANLTGDGQTESAHLDRHAIGPSDTDAAHAHRDVFGTRGRDAALPKVDRLGRHGRDAALGDVNGILGIDAVCAALRDRDVLGAGGRPPAAEWLSAPVPVCVRSRGHGRFRSAWRKLRGASSPWPGRSAPWSRRSPPVGVLWSSRPSVASIFPRLARSGTFA